MRNNKENVIDSLYKENVKTKLEIKVLEDSLKTVDININNNLHKVNEIKKEEFIVSTSLSESADLLKKNLSCAKL